MQSFGNNCLQSTQRVKKNGQYKTCGNFQGRTFSINEQTAKIETHDEKNEIQSWLLFKNNFIIIICSLISVGFFRHGFIDDFLPKIRTLFCHKKQRVFLFFVFAVYVFGPSICCCCCNSVCCFMIVFNGTWGGVGLYNCLFSPQ